MLEALQEPRQYALTPDLWRACALLAGLRVAANDPIRATDRDRGIKKNWLADMWGVVGEFIALRRLGELTDAPIVHHPIDFDRSVDDADLRVELPEGALLLEAKAHLFERGKVYFMVNARAHARSVRRGAAGYVPVLTALGARRALVGSLLTVAELDRWSAPDRVLKDPAIGVPLRQLCQEQFGLSLAEAERRTEAGGLAGQDELHEAALRAGRALARWRGECPSLTRLRARELVAAVLALDDRAA